MELTTRRHFLRAALATSSLSYTSMGLSAGRVNLAPTKHATPDLLIGKVVSLFGGISRFVKPGHRVRLKPNIGWDRLPGQAATTPPAAVWTILLNPRA